MPRPSLSEGLARGIAAEVNMRPLREHTKDGRNRAGSLGNNMPAQEGSRDDVSILEAYEKEEGRTCDV